jgi:hypothetical protein
MNKVKVDGKGFCGNISFVFPFLTLTSSLTKFRSILVQIVDYIIKSRSEMKLRSATGRSTKRPSTRNDICILSNLQAVKKKSDVN